MKLIEFRNVEIPIKGNELLKNVDFELEAGKFVFLTGKIGVGKTSFLKSLYAELPINSGSAWVLGFDISRLKDNEIPELRRKIGFIFQDFSFLNDRNIYDNLKFLLEATGWRDNQKIDKRIKDVLESVGMTHKILAKPFEVSGGELQSISIARSILNSPYLILADEPTGNLDEESSKNIVKLLLNQVNEQCSVIFVTHNYNVIQMVDNADVYKIEDKKMLKVN